MNVKLCQNRSLRIQSKITSDLSFCLAENGFSLDELVFKLKEFFENKTFSELLQLILQLVQECLFCCKQLNVICVTEKINPIRQVYYLNIEDITFPVEFIVNQA